MEPCRTRWTGSTDLVERAAHLFLSDALLDDAVGLARRLVLGKELVMVMQGPAGATAAFRA